jgi:MSHA biogenesis protein MshK
MKNALRLITFAGLLLPQVVAIAADPTRPPAAWQAEAPAAGLAESGVLRLQSVLQPQHGKPVAIIGGTTVALGGRLGEATLVRLTEREAVLQGPEGVTHLYLTPEVEKQMIVKPKSGQAGKVGRGKDLP